MLANVWGSGFNYQCERTKIRGLKIERKFPCGADRLKGLEAWLVVCAASHNWSPAGNSRWCLISHGQYQEEKWCLETDCLQIVCPIQIWPYWPHSNGPEGKARCSLSFLSYKELPAALKDTILSPRIHHCLSVYSSTFLSGLVWVFRLYVFQSHTLGTPSTEHTKRPGSHHWPANRKAGNSWMKHANPTFAIAVKVLNVLSFFIRFIAHGVSGKFGGK